MQETLLKYTVHGRHGKMDFCGDYGSGNGGGDVGFEIYVSHQSQLYIASIFLSFKKYLIWHSTCVCPLIIWHKNSSTCESKYRNAKKSFITIM